jgi:hypothetical protein
VDCYLVEEINTCCRHFSFPALRLGPQALQSRKLAHYQLGHADSKTKKEIVLSDSKTKKEIVLSDSKTKKEIVL